MLKMCDKYRETPLHKASELGRYINVQLLLFKGADINSGVFKETPLHEASEKGHEEMYNFC